MLAAPLAERVPMPALAALLIVAGYQGLRIQQAQLIWNTSKSSAAAMVLTFLATLFTPLHYAVLLGVVFSLLLYVIGKANQMNVVHLALVPGGFPEERPAPEILPSNQFTALRQKRTTATGLAEKTMSDQARSPRPCRKRLPQIPKSDVQNEAQASARDVRPLPEQKQRTNGKPLDNRTSFSSPTSAGSSLEMLGAIRPSCVEDTALYRGGVAIAVSPTGICDFVVGNLDFNGLLTARIAVEL